MLYDEWIKYDKQEELLSLFSCTLNSTKEGHVNVNQRLEDKIKTICETNDMEVKWEHN